MEKSAFGYCRDWWCGVVAGEAEQKGCKVRLDAFRQLVVHKDLFVYKCEYEQMNM